MESTIKEYSPNQHNLVEMVYNPEHNDYVVRYLVSRRFGFKVFATQKQAEKFYQDRLEKIEECVRMYS